MAPGIAKVCPHPTIKNHCINFTFWGDMDVFHFPTLLFPVIDMTLESVYADPNHCNSTFSYSTNIMN